MKGALTFKVQWQSVNSTEASTTLVLKVFFFSCPFPIIAPATSNRELMDGSDLLLHCDLCMCNRQKKNSQVHTRFLPFTRHICIWKFSRKLQVMHVAAAEAASQHLQ